MKKARENDEIHIFPIMKHIDTVQCHCVTAFSMITIARYRKYSTLKHLFIIRTVPIGVCPRIVERFEL